MTLKEGGVTLRLTCVDTPGFGDAVDNTDWYVGNIDRRLHLLMCHVKLTQGFY